MLPKILTSLNVFYVYYNHLETLPDSIVALTDLKILEISENVFYPSIPDCICQLSSLTELYISGYHLPKIPENIGKLMNLEILILEDNEFTVIPDSLGNLINLSELDLTNNGIKKLPDSIWQYDYLFTWETNRENFPKRV